ncbi:MAG: protein-L-isoaspartate(D-aspartate) O-methyltransferase [Candidatus Omnitrophota bacterium]
MCGETDFYFLRDQMIETQLTLRGIKDRRVLDAFRKVARHEFVSPELEKSAYEDHPLPIGSGQTISQPYMVALMSELLELKGQERVLEIGTGSGYQSAILAQLAKEVYSLERIEKLAHKTRERFQNLGIDNVFIEVGDGTLGFEKHSPYDAIIVTAASPEIPPALLSQLNDGGRLVIPVGGRSQQVLTCCVRKKEQVEIRKVCGCVFVPLIGKEGWKSVYE